MNWITGVFLAACLLVIVAGIAKLRTPTPAGRTVAALKVPGAEAFAGDLPIRILGLAEVLVAAAAMWLGGRLGAALMVAAFASFGAVIARALQVGSDVDCGCFGRVSSPLTKTHLVVDLAFLGAAGVGLFYPPTGIRDLAGLGATEVIALPLVVILLAATAFQLFTALPAVNRARSLAAGGDRVHAEVR